MTTINQGFQPVYDKNSKILILGSFPSVKSRQDGFYYGNKRNRFWQTLEKTFDEKIEDDKLAKTQFLLKHNIALYDIVETSSLIGSADSTLEKSTNTISKIDFLLPPHTKVEKILCNGKTAYNLLTKNFNQNIPVFYLSSTSPANPRFSFDQWQKELKI